MMESTRTERSQEAAWTAEGILDHNNGERMVPEVTDVATFWEHVYRYAFACRYVPGKRVLDIACGEGYGSAALQRAGASHVLGVDISAEACAHARRKYGIEARQGSAEEIPLPDASVDVIVSFETIEHVRNPLRFLDECKRVLRDGGTIVVSTPNKGIYGWPGGNPNPHHCSEMTEEEFGRSLCERFHDLRLYTQHPQSAGWWSPRVFAAHNSAVKDIAGLARLRRSLQFRLARKAMCGPEQSQRESVIDCIKEIIHEKPSMFNPYAIRPKRNWFRERATYLIATATR
jgi:2-polyprenyl-3-methyl-5-hydroxy-6-metoxy-1,4-benzoquinol methylase